MATQGHDPQLACCSKAINESQEPGALGRAYGRQGRGFDQTVCSAEHAPSHIGFLDKKGETSEIPDLAMVVQAREQVLALTRKMAEQLEHMASRGDQGAVAALAYLEQYVDAVVAAG